MEAGSYVGIKIHIPPLLTYLTHDQSVIEVNGNSVDMCLGQLVARYPELKKQLFGGDGKLNDGIEVYINLKSRYPEELATAVNDGDDIHIVDVIIGG